MNMEVNFLYTKQRKQFGRHAVFKDKQAEILESIMPSKELDEDYVVKNPSACDIQAVPEYSEHEVNTERFEFTSTGMHHREGGWPKEIDAGEPEQCERYRKKVQKDEDFIRSLNSLSDVIEYGIKQNVTIDIYQEYFSMPRPDLSSEPPSARTLTVFRDPCQTKRSAVWISWDGPKRVAIAYSVMQFQQAPEGMSPNSYVWDVNNPNYPQTEIVPSSPLCCLEFSPKDGNILVGGSYNGLVAYWDLRRGNTPVDTSPIEKSHRDPVYDIAWLQSKTGTECTSISTDGQVFWWDIRKLGEPTESMSLDLKGDGVVLGGVSLLYDVAGGPTKFMVGTEQGLVLSCNRKSKTPQDRIGAIYTGHHGPIYALERHPFFPKYFMTIGDWTARIWMEDLKTPIMATRYLNAYLTDGCWSPTRPGVFFTTKMDGTLDIWDYAYKQNDPTLVLQVCDEHLGLQSLRVQEQGKLVAAGSTDGTVTLIELCDSLCTPQANEKQAINQMLERETKREKNLEARAKEMRLKAKKDGGEGGAKHKSGQSAADAAVKEAEAEFWAVVNADGDKKAPESKKEAAGDAPAPAE
eukprot:tig00000241_g21009.t1